ncbi:MAG: LD-carboxypeptidase [Burkholderiales bacterium]|nr:MAG: LD-carboxypeptidase [Burkholderiales bacterium]
MTRRARAEQAQASRGDAVPAQAPQVRIDVIAPSGALLSRDIYEAGLARLRALGFAVRSRVAEEPWLRFADSDEGRLAQIHDAARARDVDAVMIARGGYGLSRLLDRIDWQLVADSARRGVRWIGFSDFTVLQTGLLATTGAPSWTGPAVCGDFGERDCDPYTFGQFRELLAGGVPRVEWDADAAELPAPIEGTLWGGNLAMIASLAGTRWMPEVEGGLLFVEDIAEHPYRVERMLLQLLHAGVLGRQRAILLGAFTDWKPSPLDNGFDLATVGRYISGRVGIPVIQGLPYGHVPRRAVLGIGLRYRLAAQGGRAADGRPRAWRLQAVEAVGRSPRPKP